MELLELLAMQLLALEELFAELVAELLQVGERRRRAIGRWRANLLLLLLLELDLRMRLTDFVDDLALVHQLLLHLVILSEQYGWIDKLWL